MTTMIRTYYTTTLLAAALVIAALASPVASAATTAAQAVGTITGRVQNSVTGNYLNNARVTIQGTDKVVYTDRFGTYRFVGIPSGPVTLEVFYTDLDPQEIQVTVPAGQGVLQDIGLTNVARYGAATNVVQLDPFLVGSNKETDADAIATNEQRFAPNIKNVISTDAMGDLVGASAGDFLKFLPGLVAEYDNAEIQGVSIRGVGSDLTAVEIDGSPTITGGHAGATRAVNLIPQSINNVSRIEVTKVPTPANPADALAWTVNMISKSAFEREGGLRVNYGINLTGNMEELHLQRTPHAYRDDNTHKIVPGFDVDVTVPIGKTFGVVFTGMTSNTFNQQKINNKLWNSAGTSTGATLSNPFLQQYNIQDSPRHRGRSFYGFKADWRVTPNGIFSFGYRMTRTVSARTGTVLLAPSAGTNGTPTPAGGVPMSYGPDFVIGPTGRGGLGLTGSRQLGLIDGDVFDTSFRFDDGRWKISANANYGASESQLNPGGEHFSSTTAAAAVPIRVSFLNIGPNRPGTIEVFDNANQRVDQFDINSYRMNAASYNFRHNLGISRVGRLDVGRRFDVFSFPFMLQGGGMIRNQSRDRREITRNWTFAGATHRPLPYRNQVYVDEPSHGFTNVPGISAVRAYELYQKDPTLLTQSAAQIATEETTRLNTSEFAEEEVTSYYLQGELRLLNNKLNVLTGVRYEKTETGGRGLLNDPNLVFQRNPDGTFARNAAGLRIRKPEAGAAGSLQEIALTRTERGYIAERDYDGFYPSLHLNYDIRENFIARFAYARTYGRPNFIDIIPTATIQEADLDGEDLSDPTISRGNITIRNTGLKPWTAQNYDLSLEYYTEQGGVFSGGAFVKDITDFFGTEVKIATAEDLEVLGLDPRYLGWNVSTKFNSGDARVSGVEVNARHSLRKLGTWGRHFTLFANATRLWLEGNPFGSFESFVPKSANWGFSFVWQRLTIQPKWNYRGLNKLTAVPAFGPDGFIYIKARTLLDVNAAYRLTPRLSLSLSFSNVFDKHLTQMRYGSETPDYAKRSLDSAYGTAFALGLRGTF